MIVVFDADADENTPATVLAVGRCEAAAGGRGSSSEGGWEGPAESR